MNWDKGKKHPSMTKLATSLILWFIFHVRKNARSFPQSGIIDEVKADALRAIMPNGRSWSRNLTKPAKMVFL